MNKPMTSISANPFVFIFSAVLLVFVIVYFGWGALDHLALPVQQGSAIVTAKAYKPPGVSYRTVIAGDRAWTLADPTDEAYVLGLTVAQESTGAIVSKEMHNAVQPGDTVHVQMRRRRLSRQLEVVEVTR